MKKRILILGADGFIGRHIAFEFRTAGWEVIACARRVKALKNMGFKTFHADLSKRETHDPSFWKTAAEDCDVVINAAGLLNASDTVFEAVHVNAPKALYEAARRAQTVLISAVGIDTATTRFARWRRAGEALAQTHNVTCLRPGLVLGDTSYGGSSLLRALASVPLTPLPGGGTQIMNPIHAADLARVTREIVETPSQFGSGPHDIGGPEKVSQRQMIAGYRGWYGLRPSICFTLPKGLARWAGRCGDFMQMGPISTTALSQLEVGVLAKDTALTTKLKNKPRGFSDFINARPAGTQDLWQARLYLLRPVLRLTLIFMWVLSGLVGLLLPSEAFLPMLSGAALPDSALIAIARLGGLADLAIALALLRGWRLKLMGWIQLALVGGYSIGLTVLAPSLWLLPVGGLLKNIPILLLLCIFLILEEER
ncbi:DoxX-like family protein [Halocynthiibacter namhaensis]|uniref:DoxX-like family protein n=1 Tax=Halocynthiibacter namhaensis TaxID=1290553 RepID=UPI0005797367|nr:DoxX-like family protein [Halocynthiibacter namhaensis]